jgi:hypothetical protein
MKRRFLFTALAFGVVLLALAGATTQLVRLERPALVG